MELPHGEFINDTEKIREEIPVGGKIPEPKMQR
jgi:hypothetical protein